MTCDNNWRDERRVAVVRQSAQYNLDEISRSVQRATDDLGISWDELIRPGDHVLVKPNLIRESHTRRHNEWEQILTHGVVIEAVARCAAQALKGQGRITIADGPQTDSDFDEISARLGLRDLVTRLMGSFQGVTAEITDLRREHWRTLGGVVVERRRMPDAPGGYTEIDLGDHSLFHTREAKFYGADYDSDFTQGHHRGGHHTYLLARIALDADVFINLPKMKTHKKVGITASLKNLVGINGDKNYLPHFTMGAADEGGDEFPPTLGIGGLQSKAIRTFKKLSLAAPAAAAVVGPVVRRTGELLWGRTDQVVRSGNWYGNDTAWRMVLDLNRILLHFSGSGSRRAAPLRYLSIVDGIVAGEGDGPMEADAVEAGLLLAGANPAAVDLVAATLMGFDWQRISMIREAFSAHALPIADFDPREILVVPELGAPLRFRPHFGWCGAIEA